jgi:hypothetical protein
MNKIVTKNTRLLGLIAISPTGCDYELEFQLKELALLKYQRELTTHIRDYVRSRDRGTKSYHSVRERVSRFGFAWKRKLCLIAKEAQV